MATIEGTTSNDALWGTDENDTLSGYEGNDYLKGKDGNDLLFGGADNDTLKGKAGNDSLFGQTGNDTIYGGGGNDSLYGYTGNDTLDGGLGDDLINGAGFSYPDTTAPQNFGVGEIDTLTGGVGKDTFELWGGSARAGGAVVDYSGGGHSDYALITDFNLNDDTIRLTTRKGGGFNPPETVSYSLGASPHALPIGTGIFIDKPNGSELIAILQGVSPDTLSLNGSYFSYYS